MTATFLKIRVYFHVDIYSWIDVVFSFCYIKPSIIRTSKMDKNPEKNKFWGFDFIWELSSTQVMVGLR